MSATLWRLSGQVESSGAEAYFFNATTTTPRATYSDAALTVPRTHPVVADANGRWPTTYLQYGDYRERVENANGTILWDVDNIANPAPPTAPSSVDPNSLFATGRGFWAPFDEAIDGFVRCNGRTIGSALSGADERANDDCQNLFLKLWNGLSNGVCPVTTGRGASAALDWAANKVIAMPDLRGTAVAGLDTMGNAAASRFDASVPFAVGNSSTPGSTAGLNHHALTSGQLASHTHTYSTTSGAGSAHSHGVSGNTGNESAHTHSGTTDNESAHTHSYGTAPNKTGNATGKASLGSDLWLGAPDSNVSSGAGSAHNHAFTTGAGSSHNHAISLTSANESTHTHAVSGTSDATGSGNNHNNTQRTMLGTYYMKL